MQTDQQTSNVVEFPTRKQTPPAWAKAAIVAELQRDKSDMMTDYFNVTTERTIIIGWSTHTKDLFAEMRKAAATFPPTAHLGPGCERVRVSVVFSADIEDNGRYHGKGNRSPWHDELLATVPEFTKPDEARAWVAKQPLPHPIGVGARTATFEWQVGVSSIEHREKYSMGSGYYLKGSTHYSDGWIVRKRSLGSSRLEEASVYDPPAAPASPATDSQAPATSTSGATVSLNAERAGVEIRFPSKPAAAVLDTLKANGWRWSRFSSCWYHRDSPERRAQAAQIASMAK